LVGRGVENPAYPNLASIDGNSRPRQARGRMRVEGAASRRCRTAAHRDPVCFARSEPLTASFRRGTTAVAVGVAVDVAVGAAVGVAVLVGTWVGVGVDVGEAVGVTVAGGVGGGPAAAFIVVSAARSRVAKWPASTDGSG
jgi:hypothetical protein